MLLHKSKHLKQKEHNPSSKLRNRAIMLSNKSIMPSKQASQGVFIHCIYSIDVILNVVRDNTKSGNNVLEHIKYNVNLL